MIFRLNSGVKSLAWYLSEAGAERVGLVEADQLVVDVHVSGILFLNSLFLFFYLNFLSMSSISACFNSS